MKKKQRRAKNRSSKGVATKRDLLGYGIWPKPPIFTASRDF